jgi:hypothetical protein
MNSKIKIGAFGSPFSHDFSSCHNNLPKKFQWDFNTQNDIEVYMDFDIIGGFNSHSKYKFLWLSESKELFDNSYDFIKNNLNIFKNSYKKIFTHCNELLGVDDIFEYCPAGSNKSWIVEGKINKKTKLVSMICSGKEITKGHKFRNDIMKVLKQNNAPVDYYGRSHNPFSKKEEALSDYCFSFVIENGSYSHYYTEKIMDCFACGTIPIYWGSPEIQKDFDINGIILFDNNFKFNSLDRDLYISKIEHINNNFLKEKNHKIADDILFDKIEKYI